MNKLLQVYGKNTDAQEIVQTELTSAFPTLVDQFNMVERIYEKFYDWMFPFVYTEDGGASMTWRANVRSWIAKNPKLAELETHFAQGTLSGTLTEKIDDSDDSTFTDNRATKQKTTFKGVDTTSSGALADEVANEFEQGKNTTENARAYSRTRTYADGRNWVQVMKDVQAAEEPVYTFINSFARLLVSPTWCKQDFCEVLPPSVEMSVEAESLPAGNTATAEIVNRGTPFNADWLLSLSLVAGETGPQGEPGTDGKDGTNGTNGTDGRNALIYASTYETTVSPNSGAIINLTNTSFAYTPVQNDYFLMNWRNTSAGTSFTCVGRVESLGNPISTCRILSFIETTGPQGPAGETQHLYRGLILFVTNSPTGRATFLVEFLTDSEIQYENGQLLTTRQAGQLIKGGSAGDEYYNAKGKVVVSGTTHSVQYISISPTYEGNIYYETSDPGNYPFESISYSSSATVFLISKGQIF